MIKKYKKKPVEVEAIQFINAKDETLAKISKFMGGCCTEDSGEGFFILIETLEGTMRVGIGDWIIKGVNGEFYPCKDKIFQKTYEKIEKKVIERKYVFSYDGEKYHCEGHTTREEVLKYAKENWRDYVEVDNIPDGDLSIYIAEAIDYTDGLNIEYILEDLVEEAYNENGEVADGYLEDITKEQQAILEERLNKIWNEFKEEFGIKANFYTIKKNELIHTLNIFGIGNQ